MTGNGDRWNAVMAKLKNQSREVNDRFRKRVNILLDRGWNASDAAVAAYDFAAEPEAATAKVANKPCSKRAGKRKPCACKTPMRVGKRCF